MELRRIDVNGGVNPITHHADLELRHLPDLFLERHLLQQALHRRRGTRRLGVPAHGGEEPFTVSEIDGAEVRRSWGRRFLCVKPDAGKSENQQKSEERLASSVSEIHPSRP